MKHALRRLVPTLALAAAGVVAAAVPAFASSGVDMRVEALPVHGKVGDTVTAFLNLYVPNTGGADYGEVTYHYVAPGGTEFADTFDSPNCHIVTPGHEAWCTNTGQLWPSMGGIPYLNKLPLKIISSHVSPGQFKIDFARDPNPANNSAPIVLTVDGITPTVAPTSPSPRPSATAAPGSPRRSTPAAAPTLPVTGSQAGILGGMGAVLVAVGGALFLLARRRNASIR
jgi:LPXTG-motif cell wall-anchored protein